MKTLLKGGRVIDPSQDVDRVADVLFRDGRIDEIGSDLSSEGAEVIDVSGLVVAPGFIDLNCHLSEPGGEHRETIRSGAMAGAAGGFTSICAMPDTDPPVDDPAAVGFVVAEGAKAGAARVYPVASISVGRRGEQLSEFGEVSAAGAIAVSDAAECVSCTNMMRLALEYAQTFDIPVISYPEDPALCVGGVMHEGMVSTRLGLRSKPAAAEIIAVARDLALAETTGGRLHLQRVSTGRSVDMIRQAKGLGVRVTMDVTPHHLLLTDADVDGYGTDHKVNPPLRPAPELEALIAGLVDGTIDAIATDHTACHYDEKEQAFDDAPFGIIGLETAFAVLHTRLVLGGDVPLMTLLGALTSGPAMAFGLPGGSLAKGSPADVTILDLSSQWTVEPALFFSKSRNTPFRGWEMTGQVARTFVGGRQVFSRTGA